jgi:iron complex outermembrane recepter protein
MGDLMGRRRQHCSGDVAAAVSGVLRALAVCAPATLLHSPPTLAQTFEPASLVTDIPSRPLADALSTFARQTGLQVVYVSSVVGNRRSHAAAAGLGADEALTRLLQGTGLRYEYLTSRSIRILADPLVPHETRADAAERDELEEVIVTANRREEELQHVPAAIQVLTGEALARLNATTFDDFVSFLPGVTAQGVGPGQNNIYVRGLATAVGGVQSSGGIGTFPNVAVYLDEQSVQLPSRNLDIYAADLERVEVLEGPQGTLFGAGAQAGVVRYITNKPKLDVSEALLNAGYASTAHGAPSSSLDFTVNVPLIANRLALRGVIYDERRGGYIDNLPATFARADSDLGNFYFYAGGKVPANSVVINNFDIAAGEINPVTYQGIRVEALYRINDEWSALLTQSHQTMEADGVFAEMAANSLGEPQPDLSVQLYNPSYNKDRFSNTALTIDGRIRDLRLLYAGAYFERNVEQVQDYTNYSRSTYVSYYQCANPDPGNPATAQCFTPSSTWRDLERNTHQSHELRLSTPGDWRLRGVGGLFYENYQIQEQVDWFYLTALPYFSPIGPPTGYYTVNGSTQLPGGRPVQWWTPGAVLVPAAVTSNNPNIRPLGDGFLNDITRGYTQKAAYASIDYDLIPNELTLTAGTRYFRTEAFEVGSSVGSFGCQLIYNPAAPNPCVNHSNYTHIDGQGLHRTFSDFKSRANVSWRPATDVLLYYTWSQGFRAGGFNRSPFAQTAGSPLTSGPNPWQAQALQHGSYTPPIAYAPDDLTNNELGWKTRWLNARLQWDGDIYQENWDQAQIAVYSNEVVNNGQLLNGGDYRVRGIETSISARVSSGLTVNAGAAWNQSELVKQATFLWADGTPVDFSTLQTASGRKVSNPGGALGSPLAAAPPFQGGIRVRYEFALDGCDAFAQIGAVHQAPSGTSTDRLRLDLQGSPINYQLAAFTTYDAAVGIGKDAWRVHVYADNLTDTRAQLYANYSQWYKAVTVSRPRTLGVRFSYKFGSG